MARNSVIESSLPRSLPEGMSQEEFDAAPDLELDQNADGEGDEGTSFADQSAEQLRQVQIEAEARREGWKPLAEFRGAPGTHRSAEEFLRRGREIAGFVKKDLERVQRANDGLTTEVRELRSLMERSNATIAELNDKLGRADKAGYDRALRELKTQQREAAASGNLETYDEIGERISEAEEAARTAATAPARTEPAAVTREPQPQVRAQVLKPEIQEFIDENPWFMGPNADTTLHTAMHAEHVKLQEKMPGLSLRDNLARAKERVVAEFPEKFGLDPSQVRPPRTPSRTPVSPPSNAGGGRTPPNRATGIDTITDPIERDQTRKAFESYRLNDADATEEEYMALIDDPKLDVLELRRRRARPPAPQQRRRANV